MRALLAVSCLVLGVGVALCTVLLHGYAWGLALGLAATAATLVALPGGWWARLAFAIGWTALLAFVTPERAEGDYLVAADVNGYVLLLAGILVLAAGFVGVRPHRPAAADADPEVRVP
ncbi:hypothetical protein GCM10022237_29910 [Nocardioides ginsengisoli]|uniref:Histidine kinase n=1 Tax=Nocardioides ginsengisoli TaxID=363868 RepID=A0ABW3VU07_9ACTN